MNDLNYLGYFPNYKAIYSLLLEGNTCAEKWDIMLNWIFFMYIKAAYIS